MPKPKTSGDESGNILNKAEVLRQRLVTQDAEIRELKAALKKRQPSSGEASNLRKLLTTQTKVLDELAARVELLSTRDDELQNAIYSFETALPGTGEWKNGDRPRILRRIREFVRTNLPRDARVVVISGGDETLVDLYGRRVLHFPKHVADGPESALSIKDSAAIIQLVQAKPEERRVMIEEVAGITM